MNPFPLLLTLDFGEEYRVYRWHYRRGRKLDHDRLLSPTLVAASASAVGWSNVKEPVLQAQDTDLLPAGRTCRRSPDGRWQWRLSPQCGWPAPDRLWESQGGAERLVWHQPGCEILDLQADPRGNGVFLAVRSPMGEHQLLHWNPRAQKAICVLRHVDFRPLEFALTPDAGAVVFVHQQDDQLYRLDLAGQRLHQLSVPQLESESRNGYRVYRCSPAVSPDGERIFYCTAYLELRDLDLVNGGNLYVAPARGGGLRRLALEPFEGEACPVNVVPPTRVLHYLPGGAPRNCNEAELIQKRRPVGRGPSSKT